MIRASYLTKLDPRASDIFRRPFGCQPVSAPILAQDARRKRSKGPPLLGRVVPNAGIEARYRRELTALIDEMCQEVSARIERLYEGNEPRIVEAVAQDAKRKKPLPSRQLSEAIDRLSKDWLSQFDRAAEKMADHFSEDVEERTARSMKKIMRDGGFSVKLKMTPAMRDILHATTEENVGLIKSIPEEYLGEVRGLVMRSVSTGRDLGSLSKELRDRYGSTKKRAALIALDQNNKATSNMVRARQAELGITRAVWHHSHASKEPRPTHVAMDGKTYDVEKGMYDSHVKQWIFPGQLIRCHCTSSSVIPGFS